MSVTTITAAEVADFLRAHPEFFNEHAELLANSQLVSPHGNRAISLQERQMEMLREKAKALEMKLSELIRYGQENDAISDKIGKLVRQLLLQHDPAALPDVLVNELKTVFVVPAAAIRLWNLPNESARDYACDVADDTKIFTDSLMAPYCGPNSRFEAAQWLSDSGDEHIASLALIPLRVGAAPQAFGLLVLGSPDPHRFTADMGLAHLTRIGEIASAALSRLLAA